LTVDDPVPDTTSVRLLSVMCPASVSVLLAALSLMAPPLKKIRSVIVRLGHPFSVPPLTVVG